MPGKRGAEFGDFVTNTDVYREDVTVADALVDLLNDTAVPVLDLLTGPHVTVGLGQGDPNNYGRNAQLSVSAIVAAGGSATLQLWKLADLNRQYAGPAPGAGSDPLPATGEWCFVDEVAISRSTFWVIKDIPPGEYKILVTAVVGGVKLREQHAA
jgi:hypothetical protein